MRKFTYVEWIAVAIALVVAVIAFSPSFVSFFIPGMSNQNQVSPNVENVSVLEGDNQVQMTNISSVDGLEIYDLEAGTGTEVKQGSTITVHYVGTFPDKTVFDTSLRTNQPFVFTVGQGAVIRGWDVGLLGMKEGGVRRLVVSSDLAYGPEGRGPIPPNATLIFEVELLKVE